MERFRIDGRSYWAVIRKAWEPFRGPRGGRGWRRTETGEVRYQRERPGEGEGAPVEERLRQATAEPGMWAGTRIRLDADPNIGGTSPTEPIAPEDLKDNPIIVTPDGEILDGYHRLGGILSYLTGITDTDHEWTEWPEGVEARIPVVIIHGTDYQAYVADEFATTHRKPWREAIADARRAMERDSDRKDIPPDLVKWTVDGRGFQNGEYVIYHGTNENNAAGIAVGALAPPEGVRPAGWYMLTTDKNAAEGYATGRSGDVVLEYRIPAEMVKKFLWQGSVRHEQSEEGAVEHGIRTPIPSVYIKRAWRSAPKRGQVEKAWQPFVGPHGGRGWKSSVTGEVRYQEDQPGEREETGAVVGISPATPEIFDTEEGALETIAEWTRRGERVRISRTPHGKIELRRALRYAPAARQPEEWALGKVTYEGDEAHSVWLQKEVAAWLMLIPEEHRDAVASIKIYDEETVEETSLRRSASVMGLAHGDGNVSLFPGEIRIAGRMSDERYEFGIEVVLHETGHQVARKVFGDMDPYDAAGYTGAKARDVLKDDPVSRAEEEKEYYRRELKRYKKQLYGDLKYRSDHGYYRLDGSNLGPLRPEHRRGKRMTKDELRDSEESLREEFRKEMGFEPEEAFADYGLATKIPASGRASRYYWTIYGVEDARLLSRGEQGLSQRLVGRPAVRHVEKEKLARAYVDAARKDAKWPSGYAEATGTTEEARGPEAERWKNWGGRYPALSEDFAESYTGWLFRSRDFAVNCPNRLRWMIDNFGQPPERIEER